MAFVFCLWIACSLTPYSLLNKASPPRLHALSLWQTRLKIVYIKKSHALEALRKRLNRFESEEGLFLFLSPEKESNLPRKDVARQAVPSAAFT